MPEGKPITDPIRIRCEGVGSPPNMKLTDVSGLCAMCGHVWFFDEAGGMVEHSRDDILAMLDRGDFG